MATPILHWQLELRDDGKLLLGLAVQNAVLDFESDRETLERCLQLLASPVQGLGHLPIGRFGGFTVTLNNNLGDSVSIFIDGPYFVPRRVQSSAIWVDKVSLCDVLRAVIKKCDRR